MSKQYKLQNDIRGETCAVTIVGTTMSIPLVPDNTDYQEYLEWLADGNTPTPADS